MTRPTTNCNWCPTGRAKCEVQGKPTCRRCLNIIRKQNDDKKLNITRIKGALI